MSDLKRATGSAVPVELAGGTWWFGRLNLGDMAELEAWAEGRYWQRVAERMAHMPESVQEKFHERALARVESGEAYTEIMSSFDGVLEMSYRSLAKRHPDLTREQVGAMIDLSDHQRIQQALDAANAQEEGGGQAKNPAAGSPPGASASGS